PRSGRTCSWSVTGGGAASRGPCSARSASAAPSTPPAPWWSSGRTASPDRAARGRAGSGGFGLLRRPVRPVPLAGALRVVREVRVEGRAPAGARQEAVHVHHALDGADDPHREGHQGGVGRSEERRVGRGWGRGG